MVKASGFTKLRFILVHFAPGGAASCLSLSVLCGVTPSRIGLGSSGKWWVGGLRMPFVGWWWLDDCGGMICEGEEVTDGRLVLVLLAVGVIEEASRATGDVKRTFVGGLYIELRDGGGGCCVRLSLLEEEEVVEEETLALDTSRNLLAGWDRHPEKRERDVVVVVDNEGAEAEASDLVAAGADPLLSEDRLRARRWPRTQLAGLDR